MGIVKGLWMRDEERGWTAPTTSVCRVCVEDTYLQLLIHRNLTSRTCDYCHSRSRKAAPVESIMEAVSKGLLREFNTFEAAGCPYGRDVPEIHMSTTANALRYLPLECNEELLSDIADSFINTLWVEAPDGMWMASHAHEELSWSWKEFVFAVKHETRFHFGMTRPRRSYSSSALSVSEVLPFLGKLLRTYRLAKKLPKGSELVRARIRQAGKSWPNEAEELGAPPAAVAGAGRMNPAGISYLYTSFDEVTAMAEVGADALSTVVVSHWKTTRELQVIDMTYLPPLPSQFETTRRRKREMLLFLWEFLHNITQPIKKDGSEHVEYVPTQVVSEYIAQVFRAADGKPIDGLIFSSSVQKGGKNIVVFPTRDAIGDRFRHVEFVSAREAKSVLPIGSR